MFAHLGRRRVGAVLVALLLAVQDPARGKSQIHRADAGVTPAGPQHELERMFAAAGLSQEQKEYAPSLSRARRSASPGDASADLGGAVGRGAERASHVVSEWMRNEDGGYSRFAGGGGDGASPKGRKKHRRSATAERTPRRLARRGLRSSAEDYGMCPRRTPQGLGRSPAEFDLASLFADPTSPAARVRRGVIPFPGNSLGERDPRLMFPSAGTGPGPSVKAESGPISPSDAEFHGGNSVPPTDAESADNQRNAPPPAWSAPDEVRTTSGGNSGGGGEGDGEGSVGVDETRNGNERGSGGEAGDAAADNPVLNAEAGETREPGPGSAGENGAGDVREEAGAPDSSAENETAAVNGDQSLQDDSG